MTAARQPPTSDPLDELRLRLRELHIHAGSPSTRDIQRRIGTKVISHTTVASLLHCAKLPPRWGLLELLVEALDGDVDEVKKLWIIARSAVAEPAPTVPAAAAPVRRPAHATEQKYTVLIVSCDIVGHSSMTPDDQRRVVVGVNNLVAETIDRYDSDTVVWASGGDGGHVVFRPAPSGRSWWREAALEFIDALLNWARDAEVELRVTGHVGDVTDVPGADGRIQIVGHGINVAGWLLTRGGPDGVVVTDAFRQEIERDGPVPDTTFHEKRKLRDKTLAEQNLLLMSRAGRTSRWYAAVTPDRDKLVLALEAFDAAKKSTVPPDPAQTGPRREGWEVLLYAKRIMQVNKNDAQARQALARLDGFDLQCRTDDGYVGPNPFFGDLDATLLRAVVEPGELVQRGYNEVICRTGDAGDTMFVILSGRVGVYKRAAGAAAQDSIEPDYSHQEGEVVGELAFALAGHRTADLVALTETELLAFNHKQIVSRLPDDGIGQAARDRVRKFITHRVLQHISERVPYLVGPDRRGPLSMGDKPVQQTLAELHYESCLVGLPDHQPVTVDRVVAAAEAETRRPLTPHGIYLLAAGSVESDLNPGQVLTATEFPLLWVNLPELPALPGHQFTPRSNGIRVLRIDRSGIDQLDLEKRQALLRALAGRAVPRG